MTNLEFLASVLGFLGAVITATGTICGAFIVAIGGGIITLLYNRQRDKQDLENARRAHAIEVTKLEVERKLRTRPPNATTPGRPVILDFLANYRDLTDLGILSPRELYLKILNERINRPEPEAPSNAPVTSSSSVPPAPPV